MTRTAIEPPRAAGPEQDHAVTWRQRQRWPENEEDSGVRCERVRSVAVERPLPGTGSPPAHVPAEVEAAARRRRAS